MRSKISEREEDQNNISPKIHVDRPASETVEQLSAFFQLYIYLYSPLGQTHKIINHYKATKQQAISEHKQIETKVQKNNMMQNKRYQ